MLVRADFNALLRKDKGRIILTHFWRAVHIRLRFTGQRMADSGMVRLPSCHEVAHGYARAFDVKAEDGLGIFISHSGPPERHDMSLTSGNLHSWNVIPLDGNTSVLLDIYPDMGLTMMPALHPYPHPAYQTPRDHHHREELKKIIFDPNFDVAVELLADGFRRIDRDIKSARGY